jgi:hypothetical protein
MRFDHYFISHLEEFKMHSNLARQKKAVLIKYLQEESDSITVMDIEEYLITIYNTDIEIGSPFSSFLLLNEDVICIFKDILDKKKILFKSKLKTDSDLLEFNDEMVHLPRTLDTLKIVSSNLKKVSIRKNVINNNNNCYCDKHEVRK